MTGQDLSWHEVHETYSRQGLTDPNAPAQAGGEIAIASPPERVWAVLTDVTRWPEIRSDIDSVTMHGDVALDSLFTWSTQGVSLTSKFGLVVRDRQVNWSTTTEGLVMSVHYVLERRSDGGTFLKCHEALSAPGFPQLGGSKELEARVRGWLEAIKMVAERGAATTTDRASHNLHE
jgi:uncharacterized membrane protein